MPITDHVTLSTEEQASLLSAVTLGHLVRLAEELVALWRGTQDSILATVTHCRQLIADNKHHAIAADYARIQGAAILVSFGRIDSVDPAVVEAALALKGFSTAEIAVTAKVYKGLCESLRDTPADGSEVSALCDDLALSLSRPISVFA